MKTPPYSDGKTNVCRNSMEILWSAIDLIQCITLRTRPERRLAAEEQFAAVGLAGRVVFLEQEPDVEDGQRGCFLAHQQAAKLALEAGAQCALTFEVCGAAKK